MTKTTESNEDNKTEDKKTSRIVLKVFLGLATSPFILFGLAVLVAWLSRDDVTADEAIEFIFLSCIFWGITVGFLSQLFLIFYSIACRCYNFLLAGFFLLTLNVGIAFFTFCALAASYLG